MTNPTPEDTRGILSPGRMMRHVEFARYPAPAELAGLVDWFWSVAWRLPMGFAHRQDVVPQPGVNVSVGCAPPPGADPPPGPYPVRCTVNGVSTGMSTRVLRGEGWNLAAKTTTGGFGAWVDDVSVLNDAALPVDDVLDLSAIGLDGSVLAHSVDPQTMDDGAALLASTLARLLESRPAARIELAREVAAVSARAERDRSIRRVDELARLTGVTRRTLQRMFATCAGVSPTWVIRRYRLLDAAEHVRDGDPVDWAALASDLGYSDQAHLTRDFTTTIGVSPAAYARSQAEAQLRPGEPENGEWEN